jgi:sugar phosphate isomerase/epimerase
MPLFIETLKKVGYAGPLVIEREVGNQQERLADCAHGIAVLREILNG